MKRFFAMMMVLCLTLGLFAACAEEGTEQTETTSATQGTEQTAASENATEPQQTQDAQHADRQQGQGTQGTGNQQEAVVGLLAQQENALSVALDHAAVLLQLYGNILTLKIFFHCTKNFHIVNKKSVCAEFLSLIA